MVLLPCKNPALHQPFSCPDASPGGREPAVFLCPYLCYHESILTGAFICLIPATAIIFLAPMSAYDQVRNLPGVDLFSPLCHSHITHRSQYLEEDPRTNRIDDSLQLFTAICQNKLLAKAALVLMLNKVCSAFISPWSSVSLTERAAGGSPEEEAGSWHQSQKIVRPALRANYSSLQVFAYARGLYSISSYGDRPNTYEEVSEYFRAHFIQTHRRKDVSHRVLYTVSMLTNSVPCWPFLT